MLLKIILGSISDLTFGQTYMQWAQSINAMKAQRTSWWFFAVCFFFFSKYNQLRNFALSKAEEEHRNDWRLVFKAGMGLLILVTTTFET